MPGTKLVLSGAVLTSECQPVANALVDFWQADSNGEYDNTGFTLRGHQYTDENGRYQLVTVVPGLYTGRTEHIHVKVQASNAPVLTTQLFFPGVASNLSDLEFLTPELVPCPCRKPRKGSRPNLTSSLPLDPDINTCPPHTVQPDRGGQILSLASIPFRKAGFKPMG